MFQIHTQKRLDVSVDSNININPDYDITGIKPKDILVFFSFTQKYFLYTYHVLDTRSWVQAIIKCILIKNFDTIITLTLVVLNY